jgi:hypothetical protein
MSQFSFESGVDEELQPRQPEPYQQAYDEPEPVAAPQTLSLSVDEFSALEERVLRAVDLVKRERVARAAAEAKAAHFETQSAQAEERAAHFEIQLREQGPQLEEQQKELSALRAERDHVRVRVERLLSQLDTLEL